LEAAATLKWQAAATLLNNLYQCEDESDDVEDDEEEEGNPLSVCEVA
jgi:hypothetical protein